MRRRKAQSASPQPNRRWQRYRLHMLLVVVIGAALAIGIAKWQFLRSAANLPLAA